MRLYHSISISSPSSARIKVECEVEGLGRRKVTFFIGHSQKRNTMFEDLLSSRNVFVKLVKTDGREVDIHKNLKGEYSCRTNSHGRLKLTHVIDWKHGKIDIGRYHCVSNFSKNNLLLYPSDILLQPVEDSKVIHIVKFVKIPSPWHLAVGGGVKKIKDETYEILNLREAIFFCGILNYYQFDVGYCPWDVYFDRALEFSHTKLLKNIRLIAEWQYRLFDDTGSDRTTLIMGAYPKRMKGKIYGYGGTVRGNSVVQFSGAGPDLSNVIAMKGLLCVLHHEMFHLYLPESLEMDERHIDDDKADLYWFTEGVTEYMAWKGALETNVITESEFLNAMATKYLRCFNASKFATHSLIRPELTAKECWADSKNYSLLYNKGTLIAWLMDLELKNNGYGGISSLLNHIFSKYKLGNGKKLNKKSLLKEYREYGSGCLRPIIRDYVTRINFLNLPVLLKEKGYIMSVQIKSKGYIK